MTKEQLKVAALNHKKACLHFFPKCKGKNKQGWVLHHKDTSLKTNDLERYAEWRIEDLVPMTKSGHISLHNCMRKGQMSDSTKRKISEKAKLRDHTVQCNAMHKALAGSHWWNNGIVNKCVKECPGPEWKKGKLDASRCYGKKNGMYKKHHTAAVRRRQSIAMTGKIFWNNGVENRRSRECPGEGWKEGRI